MAGQQHPFLSGFPNVQQTAMRTQFGGGQMVSGLIGPQQGSTFLQRFFVIFFFFQASALVKCLVLKRELNYDIVVFFQTWSILNSLVWE